MRLETLSDALFLSRLLYAQNVVLCSNDVHEDRTVTITAYTGWVGWHKESPENFAIFDEERMFMKFVFRFRAFVAIAKGLLFVKLVLYLMVQRVPHDSFNCFHILNLCST